MNFNLNVKADIVIHSNEHQSVMEALAGLNNLIRVVIQKEDQIIMANEAIEAALVKIDAATTEQGQVLAAQGATLQTISDEIDSLIQSAQNGTITPAQLARLQTLADAASTVSANLKAQAVFSTAIAAKGASTPVPGPVPQPEPIAIA